jgi:hypothetical protein
MWSGVPFPSASSPISTQETAEEKEIDINQTLHAILYDTDDLPAYNNNNNGTFGYANDPTITHHNNTFTEVTKHTHDTAYHTKTTHDDASMRHYYRSLARDDDTHDNETAPLCLPYQDGDELEPGVNFAAQAEDALAEEAFLSEERVRYPLEKFDTACSRCMSGCPARLQHVIKQATKREPIGNVVGFNNATSTIASVGTSTDNKIKYYLPMDHCLLCAADYAADGAAILFAEDRLVIELDHDEINALRTFIDRFPVIKRLTAPTKWPDTRPTNLLTAQKKKPMELQQIHFLTLGSMHPTLRS